MSQFSHSLQTKFYQETPASTDFLNHLACDLFYGILLIISFVFTFWVVHFINQVNPASLQYAGITSLESKIGANGSSEYYVVYSVLPEANTASQAVSFQQKRVSEELFYTIQKYSNLPINIVSLNPLETKIIPQALEHDPLANRIIPLLMLLLGILLVTIFGYLLIRSVYYSVQSIRLNRYGVMTYGVIRKRMMEKYSDRETEYSLVYQFESGNTTSPVQAIQTVPFKRFRTIEIGEVVRVRFHPQKPHLSRIEF